jgi:hypothetical protein
MPTDLSDYIDSLKREVTPLGSTMFDGVANSVWLGYLTDAFWEARLDGLMPGYSCDSEGICTKDSDPDADLPREYIALVVLYAGIRVLRNQILNTSDLRTKAGPVEYEKQTSATMLAEMLKQLRDTKNRIIEELDDADETSVLYIDAFSTRLFSMEGSYWGSPELMG